MNREKYKINLNKKENRKAMRNQLFHRLKDKFTVTEHPEYANQAFLPLVLKICLQSLKTLENCLKIYTL